MSVLLWVFDLSRILSFARVILVSLAPIGTHHNFLHPAPTFYSWPKSTYGNIHRYKNIRFLKWFWEILIQKSEATKSIQLCKVFVVERWWEFVRRRDVGTAIICRSCWDNAERRGGGGDTETSFDETWVFSTECFLILWGIIIISPI